MYGFQVTKVTEDGHAKIGTVVSEPNVSDCMPTTVIVIWEDLTFTEETLDNISGLPLEDTTKATVSPFPFSVVINEEGDDETSD